METANPAYQMSENDSLPANPPVYEHKRGLGGVTTKVGPPAPKHQATSKSLKYILILAWIAIIVNFLLVLGAGGVLYYYHQRFLELEGQTGRILEDGSGSGPCGPPGEKRGSFEVNKIRICYLSQTHTISVLSTCSTVSEHNHWCFFL